MYYSSDEEDSFPLDNNAAIQYVDRKQSLKMVRAKVKQRSSDIMNGEQMLSEAEQQLIQVQFPLVFAGSCKALTKCVRIAGVADTN